MQKRAYILRGLPGSGKSTVAKVLARTTGHIYSTDDYFINDGVYKFDADKLDDYHGRNKRAWARACEAGVPVIVCDNTNSQKWEWGPYRDVALKNGYEVHIITMGDPKCAAHVRECAERNIHGVPLETVQRMSKRWET